MFRHLLESKPARARSRSAAFLSLVVHVAVVGTAVAATRIGPDDFVDLLPPDPRPIYIPTPPAPAPTAPRPATPPVAEPAPAPAAPTLPTTMPPAPLDIPTTIPAPSTGPVTPDGFTFTPTTPGIPGGTGTPGTLATGGDEAMWADDVGRPAVPVGAKREPRYPAMLRESRTEGVVIATYVVDTLGRMEPESFRADAGAHPAFVQAVRQALLAQRFRPALYRDEKVRQLVQQQFIFRLDR